MNLKCPVCGKPLLLSSKTYACENRHSFDCAKSGYVNLLRSNKAGHGDNKEMMNARTAFLNTGAYGFLRDTIASILQDTEDGVFFDLGCGEGYYTSIMPGKERYGFDISKDMIDRAAKHDKNTRYVVASIFDLPVYDSSADAVLTCFAPASEPEILRVLKDNGLFVFVSPGPDHLKELKEVLYEEITENETDQRFHTLRMEKEHLISSVFSVDQDALFNLFMMTPYYYRTSSAAKEKLKEISSMSVTAQFLIRVYRR